MIRVLNNIELQITDSSNLAKYQILEIFNNKEKFFNIWRSWALPDNKLDFIYFDVYKVRELAFWENISHEVYNTPKYWWVLAFFNDILNPFEALAVGDKLMILKQDYIPRLLKQVQESK